MLEILDVGDKVDIKSLKGVREGERRPVYLSQVVEIAGAVDVKITMPTEGTKLVPLTTGEVFECCFYTKKGLYQADFQVTDRFMEGNLPVVMLRIQRPLKKVQRREYYRYSCTLPMKYRMASEDEKLTAEELNDQEWKDGVVLDLSGGGLRFAVEDDLIKDQLYQFRLVLNVKEKLKNYFLYGTLIYTGHMPSNPRLHEGRTQFIHIDESVRDEIISYIFAEERKKISMK